MVRSFSIRCLLLSALVPIMALSLSPTEAANPAKESDAFFASNQIVHIPIDIDKKDLDSLIRDPRKYARATLTCNKIVYKNVGIHVKGAAGSWRSIDDKPGLTINMNKFGEKKLFHGLDKWHLANSVQDPSYITELLCGELYRAVRVPASRVTHAIVTINGRKRGFYYLKEGYDRYFRKRHFEDHRGNFYDGGFLQDIDRPLQHLSGSQDVKKHTDLAALVTASRLKPAERFAKLEKLLDMDRFISFLCLQVITWDWDGYPMKQNNYRVYHEPKKDKIIFIPSGMDQMFGDPNGPLIPGFSGLVARAVMETPEGKKRYLTRMDEILKKHFDPDVLCKRLKEVEKRVQPALTTVDAGAGRNYPDQIKRLCDLIKSRRKSLDDQLKRTKK